VDNATLFVSVSVFSAALAIGLGGYGPARALGEALARALDSLARQPESASQIVRTLFVGMALIESIAIYALLVSLIILFANPLIKYVIP
jgi:F-type H+-transporting ATPase subunit c